MGAVVAAFLGAGGLVLAAIVLLLLIPEKVQIWASWFVKAVVYLNKKAEYTYISSNVAGHVNQYVKESILGQIDGNMGSQVKVRWHKNAESFVSEKSGTLIVRMKPHQEQEVNVLNTILAVTPKMIAPEMRSRIKETDSSAIDLQLCRKYAEGASRSTILAYREHVLEPALAVDPTLESVLESFQSIDQGGLFVPIFLQELGSVGRLYALEACAGIEEEATRFYEFLRRIAERDPGAHVQLSFVGIYIRVQVILVAKASTKALGVVPYRQRMGAGLAKGVESVYLLASGENVKFADRVKDDFDSDGRLEYKGGGKTSLRRGDVDVTGVVHRFETVRGFSSAALMERLRHEAGLEVGATLSGVVVAVDERVVTIDLGEVSGYIRRREWDWGIVKDCRDVVAQGEEVEAVVESVSACSPEVWLSRKKTVGNPLEGISWDDINGKTVEMVVAFEEVNGTGAQAVFGECGELGDVPLKLPAEEWSWGYTENVVPVSGGEHVKSVVFDVDKRGGYVIVSRKRALVNKWDEVRSHYSVGQKLEAEVVQVYEKGVWCELEPGLAGFVPAEEFKRAGLEYVYFLDSVRPGGKLYVYVRKVRGGEKQRASLGLQRNLKE